MGLSLSNAQIAQELGLNLADVQRMTEQLRDGIVARQPEPVLSGEVECDEVYVVAGHKGHPEAVRRAGRPDRRRRLKGATRPGNLREGKAADFRDDPARWRRGDSDGGEGPASDDSSPHPDVHRTGNTGPYR